MRTKESIEQIREEHGWPTLTADELAQVLALVRELDEQLARMPELSATEPSVGFSALTRWEEEGS